MMPHKTTIKLGRRDAVRLKTDAALLAAGNSWNSFAEPFLHLYSRDEYEG
jgi:hypothetical protein